MERLVLYAYITSSFEVLITDVTGQILNTFGLSEEGRKLIYHPESNQIEISTNNMPRILPKAKRFSIDRTAYQEHIEKRLEIVQKGWQEYRSALELTAPHLESKNISPEILQERDRRIKEIAQPPSLVSIVEKLSNN